MSDGGSSGGFDSGPSGGFDTGGGVWDSGPGGGPDAGGPTGPFPGPGGTGYDGTYPAGSPMWMHQQHLDQNAHFHHGPRRTSAALPTGPVGIVLFILFAIIALAIFGNISSGAAEVYPGVPSGEVVDGGTIDGEFDVPAIP